MRHLLFLMALASISLYAGANSITLGQTWEFAEKNALDEIQEHIKNNKPQIEANIKEQVSKTKSRALVYKAPNLTKLPRATIAEVYYPDMSYSLEFDIKDQAGNIIYPKGHTYTITEHLVLPYKIVVIDITDKKQLEWYQKHKEFESISYQPMTTDGNISEIQKLIPNRPVYYFNNKLIERFKVKATPSIIEQIGKQIKVSVININEEKEKSTVEEKNDDK